MGKVSKITRVATQGRYGVNQWVKSYWISYSLDGGFYTQYALQGVIKVRNVT